MWLLKCPRVLIERFRVLTQNNVCNEIYFLLKDSLPGALSFSVLI